MSSGLRSSSRGRTRARLTGLAPWKEVRVSLVSIVEANPGRAERGAGESSASPETCRARPKGWRGSDSPRDRAESTWRYVPLDTATATWPAVTAAQRSGCVPDDDRSSGRFPDMARLGKLASSTLWMRTDIAGDKVGWSWSEGVRGSFPGAAVATRKGAAAPLAPFAR